MNKSVKHQDPYKVEVGDLFCCDRLFTKGYKWSDAGVVVKVNRKTIDVKFLKEPNFFKLDYQSRKNDDCEQKQRLNKDAILNRIESDKTASYCLKITGQEFKEECYFIGSID